MKMVCCIWEDAAIIDDEGGAWVDRVGAKSSTPSIFHQIGYLCELSAEAIVLTEAVGEKQMAQRTRIPIGMVRSLVELQFGKPLRLPKRKGP